MAPVTLSIRGMVRTVGFQVVSKYLKIVTTSDLQIIWPGCWVADERVSPGVWCWYCMDHQALAKCVTHPGFATAATAAAAAGSGLQNPCGLSVWEAATTHKAMIKQKFGMRMVF
jgi:hypothetical protein